MDNKTRNTEIIKLRRKYLSLYSEHLKECFLEFIRIFRDSFIVNDDSFNETEDLFSYEISSSLFESEQKVTFKDNSVLFYLKMSKKDYCCVEIKKVISLSQDISLLRDMITTFEANQMRMCESINKDDLFNIYCDIFELAFLKNVDSKNFVLLKRLITEFKNWSSTTYEGSKVEFSVGIVDVNFSDNGTSIINFLKTKYSATISNSTESMIVISSNGNILDYITKDSEEYIESLDCPTMCKSIISKALNGNYKFSCFLILTQNSDIFLINKDGTLRGLFRGNKWQLISPETFIYHSCKALFGVGYKDTLSKDLHQNPLLKKVFSIAMDLSLSYCGGIISFVNNSKIFLKKESVEDEKNLLLPENNKDKKMLFLRMIDDNNDNSFVETNNNTLLELLSMDGAMCVDSKSKRIIVLGYILKNVKPIDGHGGRGAAAFHLSKYGLSIKVSEDGKITLYNKSLKIYEIK